MKMSYFYTKNLISSWLPKSINTPFCILKRIMCVYCIKYQDINLQLKQILKIDPYIFYFSAQCNHFGKPYSHGAIFKPKKCVTCQCLDGHVNCSRKDPIQDCPVLDCPVQDQVLEEGQCCPTCKLDFCSRGHDCHPELANCVNGLQNYTCHCKQGFKGNGTHCEGMLSNHSVEITEIYSPHTFLSKILQRHIFTNFMKHFLMRVNFLFFHTVP